MKEKFHNDTFRRGIILPFLNKKPLFNLFFFKLMKKEKLVQDRMGTMSNSRLLKEGMEQRRQKFLLQYSLRFCCVRFWFGGGVLGFF